MSDNSIEYRGTPVISRPVQCFTLRRLPQGRHPPTSDLRPHRPSHCIPLHDLAGAAGFEQPRHHAHRPSTCWKRLYPVHSNSAPVAIGRRDKRSFGQPRCRQSAPSTPEYLAAVSTLSSRIFRCLAEARHLHIVARGYCPAVVRLHKWSARAQSPVCPAPALLRRSVKKHAQRYCPT